MRKQFIWTLLLVLGTGLLLPAYGQRPPIKVQTTIIKKDDGTKIQYINLRPRINKLLASKKMRRNQRILIHRSPRGYRYYANIHDGELLLPTILNEKGEELVYAVRPYMFCFPDTGGEMDPDEAGTCYEEHFEPCMICIEDAEYANKMTCYYHCCQVIYLPN
jgi:hypothetical protein